MSDTQQHPTTCWKCENPLPAGAAFCLHCGAPAAAPGPAKARDGRKGRRWLIPVAVAVVLVLGGGAAGALVMHNRKKNFSQELGIDVHVHGDIDTVFAAGGVCGGTGGFSDITSGASVTVKDAAGKIIAVSQVGVGTGSRSDCLFKADVYVPSSAVYQVEVSHRGAVPFTKAALEAAGWNAELTLG